MAKPTTTKGNNNMTTETAAAPVKRSLSERIASTEALLAKYRAEENSLAQINNVEVGDSVEFKFGRAEKARNIAGTIIAVGDTDQGRIVAVQTGEGLDIKTVKVRAADIVSNASADARNEDAAIENEPQPSDVDPLDAA